MLLLLAWTRNNNLCFSGEFSVCTNVENLVKWTKMLDFWGRGGMWYTRAKVKCYSWDLSLCVTTVLLKLLPKWNKIGVQVLKQRHLFQMFNNNKDSVHQTEKKNAYKLSLAIYKPNVLCNQRKEKKIFLKEKLPNLPHTHKHTQEAVIQERRKILMK